MKILVLALLAFAAGCSRADRWSVATVREESDVQSRKLRVEIATRGGVPWPLRVSVAARDSAGKRIESGLPRWTAREIAPGRVALSFAEPLTAATQPVTFDLQIRAAGQPTLNVRHFLARGID